MPKGSRTLGCAGFGNLHANGSHECVVCEPLARKRTAKADRFLDRVDKRRTRRLRLRKVASNVRLTDETWALIDRNRLPMGLTRSSFIAYCVYTATRRYEQARAMRHEGEVV